VPQFADFLAADTAKWLDLATRLNLKGKVAR
jgi:hypothetical protein